MKFYKGMILRTKKGVTYRLNTRANVFRAPAWIAFRFPTGNVIEGNALLFEDTLEELIQNHKIKILYNGGASMNPLIYDIKTLCHAYDITISVDVYGVLIRKYYDYTCFSERYNFEFFKKYDLETCVLKFMEHFNNEVVKKG